MSQPQFPSDLTTDALLQVKWRWGGAVGDSELLCWGIVVLLRLSGSDTGSYNATCYGGSGPVQQAEGLLQVHYAPEPSTPALPAVGVLALFGLSVLRRRRLAAVAAGAVLILAASSAIADDWSFSIAPTITNQGFYLETYPLESLPGAPEPTEPVIFKVDPTFETLYSADYLKSDTFGPVEYGYLIVLLSIEDHEAGSLNVANATDAIVDVWSAPRWRWNVGDIGNPPEYWCPGVASMTRAAGIDTGTFLSHCSGTFGDTWESTFTVHYVPEPSALLLLTIGVLTLGGLSLGRR